MDSNKKLEDLCEEFDDQQERLEYLIDREIELEKSLRICKEDIQITSKYLYKLQKEINDLRIKL